MSQLSELTSFQCGNLQLYHLKRTDNERKMFFKKKNPSEYGAEVAEVRAGIRQDDLIELR